MQIGKKKKKFQMRRIIPIKIFFSFRFDSECLMRFILTVRKNYRNVPYHNWSHAFSVAHAIYTVIKQTKHEFTPNDVNENIQ